MDLLVEIFFFRLKFVLVKTSVSLGLNYYHNLCFFFNIIRVVLRFCFIHISIIGVLIQLFTCYTYNCSVSIPQVIVKVRQANILFLRCHSISKKILELEFCPNGVSDSSEINNISVVTSVDTKYFRIFFEIRIVSFFQFEVLITFENEQ